MLNDLNIDPFLDELIEVYGDIYKAFDPYWSSNRQFNPQYKKVWRFFIGEREKLCHYVENGFFKTEEHRKKVLDVLNKAIELLSLIEDRPLYASYTGNNTTVKSLIERTVRLRDMVSVVDGLELDDVIPG